MRIVGPQLIEVLDHGHVRLVDRMGDEATIVGAARVSYGKGTTTPERDAGLIDFLIRNEHTSPIEMPEFLFHCKMPIVTARQWVRHRTASLNEISGRYSVIEDEFYVPEDDRVLAQSKTNRQVSEGDLDQSTKDWFKKGLQDVNAVTYRFYEEAVRMGIAKETARLPLPLNIYTQWYWKMDLHNLLHFMKLRLAPDASWEIQEYARAILHLVSPFVPNVIRAWEKHIRRRLQYAAIIEKARAYAREHDHTIYDPDELLAILDGK